MYRCIPWLLQNPPKGNCPRFILNLFFRSNICCEIPPSGKQRIQSKSRSQVTLHWFPPHGGCQATRIHREFPASPHQPPLSSLPLDHWLDEVSLWTPGPPVHKRWIRGSQRRAFLARDYSRPQRWLLPLLFSTLWPTQMTSTPSWEHQNFLHGEVLKLRHKKVYWSGNIHWS